MPHSCQHMHSLLQDPDNTPLHDGHYVLTLQDLHLPTHLQLFLQTNMNSTYFPTKTQYFHHFTSTLTQWLRHHGLPTALHQHSKTFLQHQWQEHISSLRHTPRFTSRNITQLQQFLPDKLLLHNADHELQNLRVLCPQHYSHGCLTTWNTPQLVQPLPHLTHDHLQSLLTNFFSPHLRRAYPWGFRKHFQHTSRSCLFEAEEILAKKQNSHQLFPFHCRHSPASCFKSSRHYASQTPPSTPRTSLHTQPLETTTPFLPHTTRHTLCSHQRRPCWLLQQCASTTPCRRSHESSAFANAGTCSTPLLHLPLKYTPQATPFNILTLADTTSTIPNKVHST